MNDLACLRAMRDADLDAVCAIEQQVSPDPWRRTMFTQSIIDHQARVMLVDEVVGGFLICSRVADEGEILNVAVAPQWQGLGYGYWLLQQLELQLGEQVSSIYLEVRASNFAAIGLYQRCGFEQVGVRRDYYRLGPGREDALIMSKAFG